MEKTKCKQFIKNIIIAIEIVIVIAEAAFILVSVNAPRVQV